MTSARVVAIVQARSGSTRLPGKAMRPLAGKAMILHVLERTAAMGYPTWLATTLAETDDPLFLAAVQAGFPVFRGDERDVLGRMAGTAEAAQADVVVRVTGDCPVFAPDVGALVVGRYLSGHAGQDVIVTNDTTRSGYPDGLDVEVFPMALLRRACAAVPDPAAVARQADEAADDVARRRTRAAHDREHVTPWMRRHAEHHVVESDEDWRRVKLSVDSLDDFDRVRAIMGHLRNGDKSWPATRAAVRAWQAGREA